MGRVADASGIQFHLLNASRGPAVQGPRAQMDRALYKQHMQAALASVSGLRVHDGAVADLILEEVKALGAGGATATHRVAGVVLADGSEIRAAAVVITTGTFLRGVLHIGSRTVPAGRMPTASTAAADASAAARGGARTFPVPLLTLLVRATQPLTLWFAMTAGGGDGAVADTLAPWIRYRPTEDWRALSHPSRPLFQLCKTLRNPLVTFALRTDLLRQARLPGWTAQPLTTRARVLRRRTTFRCVSD